MTSFNKWWKSNGDGYGADEIIKDAYRAGQEAMREACVKAGYHDDEEWVNDTYEELINE
jgi:hypothetical protein